VVRLTENLAVELAAAGISVNAIAPGFVATPIHEATLQVGSEMAGDEHFRRTQQLLQEGAVPMEVPVACVKFLLSDRAGQLTGKTISASFDPWDTADFVAQIPQINQSDLYTLRRINLVNLPDRELCGALSQPSQEEGGQGRQ
jgi:3-oxoacyl-[acyl-carrier protein] reductase